jgi:hypothetical protein
MSVIDVVPVNEGFYASKRVNQIPGNIPDVLGNYTTFTYNKLTRVSNEVQRRPKPKPLSPTALSPQSTTKLKASTTDWTFWYGDWYDYNYYRSKGIRNYAPTIPDDFGPDMTRVILDKISERFVNLGSSLAEYRATGEMFHQYATGVRDAWRKYRDLRKLKFRKKLTPCSVNSAELAYSFGVAPLAGDLYSAVEALKLRLGEPITMAIHATRSLHQVDELPDELDYWKRGYVGIRDYKRVTRRANLAVQLHPTNQYSITFGNPTNWAWELTPFSFVVDWGIDIGGYLEALDTLRRIDSLSGTMTQKRWQTIYWKRQFSASAYVPPAIGDVGKLVYKEHSRLLMNSLPLPPLPRWEPSATWRKLHRAVSLLIAVNQPCRKYSGRRG